MSNAASDKDLQRIPGIGPRLAERLSRLGYRCVADLKGEDPEAMYERAEAMEGAPLDRCVLYTFRCAVYYASHEMHDPERLKWWNWMDARL